VVDGSSLVAGEPDRIERDVRPLPEDTAELEKVIKPYRVLVAPLVTGVSHTLEVIGTEPLAKDEQEGGVFAGSAFMYQYLPHLDAKYLLLMWIVGVSTPRLAKLAADMRKERKKVVDFSQATAQELEAQRKASGA
jgi:hypothetical protein